MRRVLCAVLALSCARCTCSSEDCTIFDEVPSDDTALDVEVIVDGLEVPWGIAFLPPGEPADFLVTERAGRLRAVRGGVLDPTPIAQVEIVDDGEGGLLGLAADPDFAVTRAIYLYGSFDDATSDANRVERWLVDPDVTTATRDLVVLDGIPRGARHDGGRIRFAPDGTLVIGTGETGDPALSRDDDTLAGKLLRISKDGDVPDDNPDPDSAVIVKGIRNTQGFDFLDGLDRLVIADHGPSGEFGRSGHDEINLASPGDDLGWPDIFACEAREGLVSPVATWREALPPGGIELVDDAVPAWRGKVVVAALRARQLQIVDITADPVTSTAALSGDVDSDEGFGRLRDVLEGPDGALWVTTSNCDGRGTCPARGDQILRITAR